MSAIVAAGLSIGEFGEVVAACGVVVGFGVGGINYRLRAVKRAVDERERAAAEDRERHAMLLLVVERGLAGTINSLDFVGGLVQRLAQNRTGEVAIERLLGALGELRSDVERPWLEARTMTDEMGIQLSALQLLEQRLGNSETAAFLKRGAETGTLGEVEPEKLLRAADEITKREREVER
jgi:hypothetical protein